MSPEPVVFIVDDDRAVRVSSALMLQAAGLTVKSFQSAEAFLTEYEPERFGCLLVDIRLPGMSGVELLQVLKNDGIDLPVILISGHASAEVRRLGKVSGAIAVLEKPVKTQNLVDWIDKALRRN